MGIKTGSGSTTPPGAITPEQAHDYLVIEREELKAVGKAAHQALLDAAEDPSVTKLNQALQLLGVLNRLLDDDAALNTAGDFLCAHHEPIRPRPELQ